MLASAYYIGERYDEAAETAERRMQVERSNLEALLVLAAAQRWSTHLAAGSAIATGARQRPAFRPWRGSGLGSTTAERRRLGATVKALTHGGGMVRGWWRGVVLAVAVMAVSGCSAAEPSDEAASAAPSPVAAPSVPAIVVSETAAPPGLAVPSMTELPLPSDVTDLSSEQLEQLREDLDRLLEQRQEEMLEDLPVPELPSELLDDVVRP